jgi:hypothetical protein
MENLSLLKPTLAKICLLKRTLAPNEIYYGKKYDHFTSKRIIPAETLFGK